MPGVFVSRRAIGLGLGLGLGYLSLTLTPTLTLALVLTLTQVFASRRAIAAPYSFTSAEREGRTRSRA